MYLNSYVNALTQSPAQTWFLINISMAMIVGTESWLHTKEFMLVVHHAAVIIGESCLEVGENWVWFLHINLETSYELTINKLVVCHSVKSITSYPAVFSCKCFCVHWETHRILWVTSGYGVAVIVCDKRPALKCYNHVCLPLGDWLCC